MFTAMMERKYPSALLIGYIIACLIVGDVSEAMSLTCSMLAWEFLEKLYA